MTEQEAWGIGFSPELSLLGLGLVQRSEWERQEGQAGRERLRFKEHWLCPVSLRAPGKRAIFRGTGSAVGGRPAHTAPSRSASEKHLKEAARWPCTRERSPQPNMLAGTEPL